MNFKVIFNEGSFRAAVEGAASKVIRRFVFDVVTQMKLSFTTPKTGRIYRVSRTGRPHQASAPGEAPAIDTGLLTNSIQTEFPSPLTGIIGIGAEYAAYLEAGTRFMAARPYIEPAISGALDALERDTGVIGRLI